MRLNLANWLQLVEQGRRFDLPLNGRHGDSQFQELYWTGQFTPATESPCHVLQLRPEPFRSKHVAKVTRIGSTWNAAKSPIFGRRKPARQHLAANCNCAFPALDLAQQDCASIEPVECFVGRIAGSSCPFWEKTLSECLDANLWIAFARRYHDTLLMQLKKIMQCNRRV